MSRLLMAFWWAAAGLWCGQALFAAGIGDWRSATDSCIAVVVMLTNVRLDFAIRAINQLRSKP